MGSSSSKRQALDSVERHEDDMISLGSTDSNGESKLDKLFRKSTKANPNVAEQSKETKWSNPDPYSALPPTLNANGPRTDFVRFIRESRGSAEEKSDSRGEGNDYIDLSSSRRGSNHSDRGQQRAVKGPSARTPRHAAHHDSDDDNSNHLSYTLHNSKLQPPTPWWRRYRPQENRSSCWAPATITYASEKRKRAQRQQGSDRSNKRKHDEISKRDPYHSTSHPNAQDVYLLAEWTRAAHRPWLEFIPLLPSNIKAMAQMHIECTEFFYSYLQPRGYENRMRQQVIDNLQRFFDAHFPGCMVRSFGSFAAGLYLPTADMDVVIITQDFVKNNRQVFGDGRGQVRFGSVNKKLVKSDLHSGRVTPLLHARVPLIKYVDQATHLRVDLSFENFSGLVTNDRYNLWLQRYEGLAPLVVMIKLYLNMRDFDDPSQGGIGGFTVTCLVVFLLHHWAELTTADFKPGGNLGFALYKFFDFYGNRQTFDVHKDEINMRSMEKKEKQQRSPALVIRDPDDPSNNIARASKNAPYILSAFNDAFKRLNNRMDEIERTRRDDEMRLSILDVLYTGDYEPFNKQRFFLLDLDDDTANLTARY
ncbi:MAG: hypothetical protein Q9162_002279 [Coniocarpon cinnabarinum]